MILIFDVLQQYCENFRKTEQRNLLKNCLQVTYLNNNELKQPAKQVAKLKLIGIVSLSHTMQKSLYVAVDWFPISTAEFVGLMLNPKTNANKAGAIGLASEKYDDQTCSAANTESQSATASDLIGCKESYSQ